MAARLFGLDEVKTSEKVQETKENDVQTLNVTAADSVQEDAAEESASVTEPEKGAVTAETVAAEAVQAEEPVAEAEEEAPVYITPGMEWRATMKTLEEQVEKELGKANSVINDIIAEEKAKCRALVEKQFKDKEDALVESHTKEVSDMKEQYEEEISSLKAELKEAQEALKAEQEEAAAKQKEALDEAVAKQKEECDAELEKMKTLYAQQLDEVQEAFREKTVTFRREIDQYKEQVEVLMLHIDDPFVLQEMEMKQTQEAAEKANAESAAAAAEE